MDIWVSDFFWKMKGSESLGLRAMCPFLRAEVAASADAALTAVLSVAPLSQARHYHFFCCIIVLCSRVNYIDWLFTGLLHFTALCLVAFHRWLRFLQIADLRQPCAERVCQRCFPIAFACFMSVSHLGNSWNISNPPPAKTITVHWRLRRLLATFRNKVLF